MSLTTFVRSWLVYDTTKIVRIYDKSVYYFLVFILFILTYYCYRRLAVLYYSMVLLITGYTFYSIVVSKGK